MNLLDQLIVYAPTNNKKRLGSNGDGGYVIVDGYNYDYYIGCGVGGDVSFDMDMIRHNPSIGGLVFDGEIKNRPYFSHSVHFVAKNISSVNTDHETNLNVETKQFNDIFVKMDIEAHEWNWIPSFENFDNVKQLVIEVHGLFDPSWMSIGKYEYEDICRGLMIINQTHHLVHFHSNSGANYMSVNDRELPSVAEFTFIRKRDCKIDGFNKTTLPISMLDFRNSYDRHDLILDSYPFVNDGNVVA